MIAITERQVRDIRPLAPAQPQVGLIDFLRPFLAVLWKEWPKNMELSSVWNEGFGLRGVCPHCGTTAAFQSVTKTYMRRMLEGRHIDLSALCVVLRAVSTSSGFSECKQNTSGGRWPRHIGLRLALSLGQTR